MALDSISFGTFSKTDYRHLALVDVFAPEELWMQRQDPGRLRNGQKAIQLFEFVDGAHIIAAR